MKIAIFGSNGLLGTAASRQFAAGGHQVVRISRSEEADYAADASDMAAVEKIVSREKPEVVLNAIKSAQSTDAAEEQRAVAWASNVIVPQNLASLCEKFSCKLVHISSDWVYEGRESEVYTEESLPYPQNFYAYTKAVAEERVRLLCPGSLILRTTGLFGPYPKGLDAFSRLRKADRLGEEFAAADDQFSQPIWAGELARVIEKMAAGSEGGTFNAVGPDYVSRYELAQRMRECFGFGRARLTRTMTGVRKIRIPAHLKVSIAKIEKYVKIKPLGAQMETLGKEVENDTKQA